MLHYAANIGCIFPFTSNIYHALESMLGAWELFIGALKGGGVSGAMCYVQSSLACYVLCKFLFTLLCETKIGYYSEV